ncbi:MAG: hypothetical protein WA957_10970 [Alteraurantiacibacter sp.]
MTQTEPARQIIWSLEVLAFLTVAISGLALLPARPLIGAAIAAGGIVNTIQAGMGLVMFGPLGEGGDAVAPVFTAVLSMAFLLYFAGKVAFGVAALAAGVAIWRGAHGATRIMGGLAALTGLIAVGLNALAIIPETQITYVAGGAGTVATLLLALVLVPAMRGAAPEAAEQS